MFTVFILFSIKNVQFIIIHYKTSRQYVYETIKPLYSQLKYQTGEKVGRPIFLLLLQQFWYFRHNVDQMIQSRPFGSLYEKREVLQY